MVIAILGFVVLAQFPFDLTDGEMIGLTQDYIGVLINLNACFTGSREAYNKIPN